MASKYLQKFPVPQGFQEVLADFTKEVLRAQPANILQFAASYFQNLQKGRNLNISSTRKIQGLSSREAEDITKRAANIAGKIGEPKHQHQPQQPQQSHQPHQPHHP